MLNISTSAHLILRAMEVNGDFSKIHVYDDLNVVNRKQPDQVLTGLLVSGKQNCIWSIQACIYWRRMLVVRHQYFFLTGNHDQAYCMINSSGNSSKISPSFFFSSLAALVQTDQVGTSQHIFMMIMSFFLFFVIGQYCDRVLVLTLVMKRAYTIILSAGPKTTVGHVLLFSFIHTLIFDCG